MMARKTLLPAFVVTRVADSLSSNAVEVLIPPNPHTSGGSYFIQPKHSESSDSYSSKKSLLPQHRYNLFPLVLDADGIPWAEANMWILSSLEGALTPSMSTYASIAEDLAAYRRFLDAPHIDWLSFPSQKLERPTYRFNGHLNHLIQNGELAPSTAKRRMATIIRFYRWLQEENIFKPENSPWKASDRYIGFSDRHGFKRIKVVTTTDVSIRVSAQYDPYVDTIIDGGKLRPLSQGEQQWLLDALFSLGNTEMVLIHLFGMVSGARIQTILTFRVKHVLSKLEGSSARDVRIPVGPGTSIDTKHNKQMVLHIPVWFYQLLRTYALSERAVNRRRRATGGDTENQYLFLSVRGSPHYISHADASTFDSANKRRHSKIGQGIRQFIREKVVPLIQEKHGVPNFHFQFHDTRATYGMNLVDEKLKLVEEKKITLKEVMSFVQARMGHESLETTELYLTYRNRLVIAHKLQDAWESKLESLVRQGMRC